LYSVDLSASHKSGGHSFSGSSSEKSEVSGMTFQQSNVVDFVPAELTREFPKLNALDFQNSNVPVVKTDFFGSDFKNLEFLVFWACKVEAIEDGAFTELENLKFILIAHNALKTLPFGLFRNNMKLEIAGFESNKISMIHPTLFDDLKNLKVVNFDGNVCVSKSFGCTICTVSQSELKSALSTCFANCRAVQECSASERTTTPKIEIPTSTEPTAIKSINLDSTCEAILKTQSTENEKIFQKTAQVEANLSLFIAKESNFMADLQSLTTKNFEAQNFVIENATKALKDSNDLTMSDFKALFQDQVQKFEESNNETAESLNENLAGKISVALENENCE
jgi:hypothetical protein